MSTENNASSGQTQFSSVQFEANDIVMFVSKRVDEYGSDTPGRRRNIQAPRSTSAPNVSSRLPSGPVTALMTNAEFRIVDPCAGHDCSADEWQPQWTPRTDATTAVSAQLSPATTASSSSSPTKEAKSLKKAAEQGAPNNAEITNNGNEDSQSVPEIKVVGEPVTKPGKSREVKQASASRVEQDDDKPFGKIRALSSSTLTEAERLVWSSAQSINSGPMRDKELIAYQSQKQQRMFKFVLAGPSSLDEYAFDFFCLDCWINHAEECRVTVGSWSQQFIITDPDRTSSGRHACTPSSSARPSGSPAVAKEPLSALADAEARTESHVFPVVETPAQSMEYDSERYQAKLNFVRISKGKKGQVYYACIECRTLKGKLKDEGYQRFGYTRIRVHHAIVVGGKFVQRHPDECGVELLIGDTVTCRHICHDDNLKKLLDVESAKSEEPSGPSPKRMRDATHGPPNECTVRNSIHKQSANGSRADTSLHNDSDRTPTDQHAGAHAELSRRMDAAVDQAIKDQATTTRYDESSRQSEDIDLGPAVDALDESQQPAESTYSVSSAAQNVISPHEREANMSTANLDVADEQKPLRFDERREGANADDSNNPTSSSSKTNKTSRFSGSATTSGARKRFAGSSVEDKSSTKKSPEVFTVSDSDEDTDANGANKTSKKQVKREPVENNDEERDRDPAAKFHRFIRAFDLVDEYARYSVYNNGEPTAFVKQRHVIEKWIKFNQRN